MKKRNVVLILALILAMITLVGCEKTYSEDDVIGYTSLEIIEKYGDFDRKQGAPDEDGMYRDCACGYLIREERVGFLGTTPPKYFMVYFNDDGIADFCRYEEVV